MGQHKVIQSLPGSIIPVSEIPGGIIDIPFQIAGEEKPGIYIIIITKTRCLYINN